VVTRLPAVDAGDLPQIAPSDRAYVAAEMTAFLLAWLTGLTCPVLNRPTPQCLSGPLWGRERWALAAAKLGIPARPVLRRAVWPKDDAEAAHGEPGPAVTVVGRSHIGIVDDVLAARAHRLARAAGVDLLSVEFDGRGPDARFVAASLWPDVGDARIAEPMMALLRDRTAGRIGDRRA